METLIRLLQEASSMGFDIGELLILGAMLYIVLLLRDFKGGMRGLRENFEEHESDCKENRADERANRRKMWEAINDLREKVAQLVGISSGKG